MEKFPTAKEILESNNFNFQILIKFGSDNNLLSLQHGTLYMKNIKYYNDLIDYSGSGKPDKYDGKWALNDVEFHLYDPETGKKIAMGTSPKAIISPNNEFHPVFCMFSFDYRNCNNSHIDFEKQLIIIESGFSEEQKEKIKEGLGEYALVITNKEKFICMVDEAFKRENLEYEFKNVAYNMGNTDARINSILQDDINFAYNKDIKYAYQQEARFLIKNREETDYMEVSIGDISDISKLFLTEELLDMYIELRLPFYTK